MNRLQKIVSICLVFLGICLCGSSALAAEEATELQLRETGKNMYELVVTGWKEDTCAVEVHFTATGKHENISFAFADDSETAYRLMKSRTEGGNTIFSIYLSKLTPIGKAGEVALGRFTVEADKSLTPQAGSGYMKTVSEDYTEAEQKDLTVILKENKPDDNESKPDDNETKPDDNETKPDDNETKPDDNETKPGGDESKPDDNETKPDDNETKPDDNETKPGDNESKPDDNDSGPDNNDARPENGGSDNNNRVNQSNGQVSKGSAPVSQTVLNTANSQKNSKASGENTDAGAAEGAESAAPSDEMSGKDAEKGEKTPEASTEGGEETPETKEALNSQETGEGEASNSALPVLIVCVVATGLLAGGAFILWKKRS